MRINNFTYFIECSLMYDKEYHKNLEHFLIKKIDIRNISCYTEYNFFFFKSYVIEIADRYKMYFSDKNTQETNYLILKNYLFEK